MTTKKDEQEMEDATNEALGTSGNEDFLPEGTSIPKAQGNYMRLSEPENRFRVLGSAVTGFELWVAGKPLRKKTNDFAESDLQSADVNKFTGKKKIPQYFWAFPVWNYQTNKVEILEITQVTVMRGIEDFLNDEDYGKDPRKYDIVVIRDDSGDKVEYRVKAKPPKELTEELIALYNDMSINLKKLFDGGDPFSE